jgi:hypothetical protein
MVKPEGMRFFLHGTYTARRLRIRVEFGLRMYVLGEAVKLNLIENEWGTIYSALP